MEGIKMHAFKCLLFSNAVNLGILGIFKNLCEFQLLYL